MSDTMKHLKKLKKIFLVVVITFITIYSGTYFVAKITPKLSIKSANKYVFYDISGNTYNGDTENHTISGRGRQRSTSYG